MVSKLNKQDLTQSFVSVLKEYAKKKGKELNIPWSTALYLKDHCKKSYKELSDLTEETYANLNEKVGVPGKGRRSSTWKELWCLVDEASSWNPTIWRALTRSSWAKGDKIQHRYASTQLDEVWTADVTELGSHSLLVYVDQTTRQVVGHLLRPRGKLTTRDCVDLLNQAIMARQAPRILHSDSGSIFVSSEMREALKSLKVSQSIGTQKYIRHHNQVHERLNRTLKSRLQSLLEARLGISKKSKGAKYLSRVSPPKLSDLVYKTIEDYNNSSHARLLSASPNSMETAVSLYGGAVSKSLFGTAEGQLCKESSSKGELVKVFRAEVLHKYAGDWQHFFIDWYLQSRRDHQELRRNHQELLKKQREESDRIISELQKDLQEANEALESVKKRMKEQESDLSYLKAREESREHKERELEEARARRAARKRQPLRSAACYKEYTMALEEAKSHSKTAFVLARTRVALLLLYITGARVSSLTLMEVKELVAVRQVAQEGQGELRLPSLKSGSQRSRQDLFTLPSSVKVLVKDRIKDLDLLTSGVAESAWAFRSEASDRRCHRVHFTNSLNKILREVGKKLHKKLRTHSFRIGLVTSLIERYGIDSAKQIIGHNFIGTTEQYNRRVLRGADVSRMLNKILGPKAKRSVKASTKP